MKKLFLITAIVTLLGLNVYAADDSKKDNGSENISYVTLNRFEADFKEAKNVVWSVNKNCQRADFTVNDEKMNAFYNFDGEFIGLTHNVDAKAIPAKAMKQINKHYKGYNIGSVIVLQTNASLNDNIDPVAYFVELKNTKEDVLVRVTSQADIEFFQQVK